MKSRITLEPSVLDEELPHGPSAVKEVWICVERYGECDEDATDRNLFLSPEEMQFLYHRMRLYYEDGIWTTGTVEW